MDVWPFTARIAVLTIFEEDTLSTNDDRCLSLLLVWIFFSFGAELRPLLTR